MKRLEIHFVMAGSAASTLWPSVCNRVVHGIANYGKTTQEARRQEKRFNARKDNDKEPQSQLLRRYDYRLWIIAFDTNSIRPYVMKR